MKNIKIKLILLFSILSINLYPDALIPGNQCALIVASRASISEAKDYINNEVSNTKNVNVYESKNGWYAISIGFLKSHEVKPVMGKWKKSGKIPQDSFS